MYVCPGITCGMRSGELFRLHLGVVWCRQTCTGIGAKVDLALGEPCQRIYPRKKGIRVFIYKESGVGAKWPCV